MKPEKLRDFVVEILEDNKAQNIVVLPIHKLTYIADYMIVCSGTSGRHVRAVAENLIVAAKKHGVMPFGVEDDPSGTWTLIDLGDVIVHVMQPETREFYKLEKLWKMSKKERDKE